ncbi:hypothetical protein DFH08DRAFT_1047468 [Mycena albidolilacea]|uniref:Uncharacterized protein n=1 Tax=Mycena albidolilacea TaxID=1033008 RepID=A0AAD7AEK5_9AGAR|nr:hypothetical protein DFH08DRAFT_1047468 [Mycena albidolilacea]
MNNVTLRSYSAWAVTKNYTDSEKVLDHVNLQKDLDCARCSVSFLWVFYIKGAVAREWTWSHLSQHFRNVVVGTPELWTLTEADLSVEGSVEILKLYLEHSRTWKISTMLRDCSYSNAVEEGFLIGDRDLEMLVPFRDETAPYLQHLEIVYASRNDELPSLVMFSSRAPRLNSLKVDGFALQLPAAALTASLTHLELRRQQDLDINNFAMKIGFTSLHISIAEEACEYLLEIIDIFDTPALTELVIRGTHGDQIPLLLCSMGLPHSSFPALTTLSFIYTGSCNCEISDENRPSLAISSPLIVFPALSHLTLINQCYTEHLIRDILGPASESWPLLKIITLGVKNNLFEDVCGALTTMVNSKRHFPKTIFFVCRYLF